MKKVFYHLILLSLATVVFVGCTSPKQPPLPIGSLRLGLAFFTQPQSKMDMLAGYMPDNTRRIEVKELSDFDSMFSQVLAKNSKNKFVSQDLALQCYDKVKKQTNNSGSAIRTWSAVGTCMNVDLLLVPQVYELRERNGGSLGVVSPAKVIMDFFIVDVKNESLISRSHFDETQHALSDNLLEAGKFFKRKGKWIESKQLANEAMEKAIQELGL